MIQDFLSSPEGQVSIRDYLKTPQGKKTAMTILPLFLDTVDLPGDIRNSVMENLGKKN